MIHFVFSEQDIRYLFLKFDNKDDERNLKKLLKMHPTVFLKKN